ncbi:ABC transporter ATP-binding protein [Rhizobium albus]|nr:ABC transporter ATP-binding protein [Rhizobium albus]
MLDRTNTKALSATPVSGHNLKIERSGRLLLGVEQIVFGGDAVTAILGPNGAGKSMLIKTLAGLQKPDRGDVSWNGSTPSRDGYRKVGMLLQHPVLFRRSAIANVIYALKQAGQGTRDAQALAHEALDQAGLSAIADTSARLLSGGEKQRLAMARALALKPEILFLDEPTASLDPASTLRIEEMIGAAAKVGTIIVLVTHDMAQARRLSERVLLMHRGRIIEAGRTADFFDRPNTPEARAFAAGEILL